MFLEYNGVSDERSGTVVGDPSEWKIFRDEGLLIKVILAGKG